MTVACLPAGLRVLRKVPTDIYWHNDRANINTLVTVPGGLTAECHYLSYWYLSEVGLAGDGRVHCPLRFGRNLFLRGLLLVCLVLTSKSHPYAQAISTLPISPAFLRLCWLLAAGSGS